jgi:sugar phosphate isomerase/epimerase
MFFGYNTNGFAHHPLDAAIEILADLGYRGVAITLDYHALNPFDLDLLRTQVPQVGRLLARHGLRSVIETGARFLLDPWNKHQPTLLDPDLAVAERRFEFLRRAIKIAAELGSDAVSFWSGTARQQEDQTVLLERLANWCRPLCDFAEHRDVRLAFEPEPGMFIDTIDRFAELERRIAHPRFGLTIDVGHLHCQGEVPIDERLRRWRRVMWNVHIEDMRRGVHGHLMFGEGEIDFAPVLRELQGGGYAGGVYVELSRHGHDAVNTARRALAFLHECASAGPSAHS